MIFELVVQILALIGGLYILYKLSPLYEIIVDLIFPLNNHLKIYGKNSWVIVTGATDGIGKGFCEEFAKRGFNILLVSRNQ